VLGVLILRYLGAVVAVALFAFVLAILVIAGTFVWFAAREHWDIVVGFSAAFAVGLIIVLAIQYLAKGLGYLFVVMRPKMRESMYWHNFLTLVDVEPSWITTPQESSRVAREVGDILLKGIFKLVFGYAVATLLVFLLLMFAGKNFLAAYNDSLVKESLWASAILPGIALVYLIRRRSK
jgi:hypothetical protein